MLAAKLGRLAVGTGGSNMNPFTTPYCQMTALDSLVVTSVLLAVGATIYFLFIKKTDGSSNR